MFRFISSVIRIFESRPIRRDHRYDASQNSDGVAYTNKAESSDVIREKIQELPRVYVSWVLDGDTIDISHGWSNKRVRLDSIDCPEDGQPWGDVAKYALIKMIGGQKVYFEEHGIDVHGRTLATLYIWNHKKADWLNVNERMVTLGHAWVMYKCYDHLPLDRQDKLNSLEKWARSKKIGLWQLPNPTPPWLWRKEE